MRKSKRQLLEEEEQISKKSGVLTPKQKADLKETKRRASLGRKSKGFDALGGADVEPKGLTFWNPEKVGEYVCGQLNNKFTTKLNYQMYVIIGSQEHNQDESIVLPSHVELMMRLDTLEFGDLIGVVFDGKEGRQYKYRVKKLF